MTTKKDLIAAIAKRTGEKKARMTFVDSPGIKSECFYDELAF